MAVLQVIIVARTVEVGGHGRNEVVPVLVSVRFAQLNAGDFGDGVWLVGGLQRPCKDGGLCERLRRHFGVDATGPQEQQLPHFCLVRGVDEVGLNHEVVVKEICSVNTIGVDAAHFGRGNEHVRGFFLRHHVVHGGLVAEVQFCARKGDGVGEALGFDGTTDGLSDHSAVAGDIDSGLCIHGARNLRCWGSRSLSSECVGQCIKRQHEGDDACPGDEGKVGVAGQNGTVVVADEVAPAGHGELCAHPHEA